MVLTDALSVAIEISKEKQKVQKLVAQKVPSYTEIRNIVVDLVTESHGGESLTLAVGGLVTLLSQSTIGQIRVEVHPVNQCGASSREIGDIDVYLA